MRSDVVVGRPDVTAALTALLTQTHPTEHAVVLTGDRGAGRTTCLRIAAEFARARGDLVVDLRGNRTEARLAYAGLHRLLRPLRPGMAALPDRQRQALTSAMGIGDDDDADPLLVCLATLAVLRAAAGVGRLVLAVDDLDLLDERTRQVVGFVARRLDGKEIVLATAVTSSDPDPTFVRIHLDPLDDSDAHRLVRRHGPELTRAERRWVVAHAGGSPLALCELAATTAQQRAGWAEDIVPALTPRLEQVFAEGLDHVTGPAHDALLVAAVAAEPRVAEILAATRGVTGEPVGLDALDAAASAGLITVDETWVRFRHPLVRAAVLAREPVSRRQQAHRALGAVVTVSARRRAWHKASGATRPDDDVAADLESLVTEAVRLGETATAIAALERAAELSTGQEQRHRRLLLAARHAAALGRRDTVRRLLTAVTATDLSDLDRLRVELLREDPGGFVINESRQILRWCRASVRAAAAGDDEFALELAEAAVRRRCASAVDDATAAALRQLASDVVARSGRARAVCVVALADPVVNGRDVMATLSDLDPATADAKALSSWAVAARAVGDYPTASRFLDRAELPLRTGGLLGPLARNLGVAADVRFELGEWDRAAAALAGFEVLALASMSPSHRASALTTRARLAASRGDVSTALDLVEQAEYTAEARSGSRVLARAHIARAVAWASAGRHDDAYAVLARVFDSGHPSHHPREQWDALSHLCDSAAHDGRDEPALRVVERLRSAAEVSGSPLLAAQVAYADAVLAPDEHAEDRFLAALTAGCGGSVWLRARLQLAYGRWLRRAYRVSESRAPLEAALGVFDRLGAAPWAAQARDESAAAGVVTEPAATATTGFEGAGLLSNQEARIAHLAARGLTNREIGAQLYLSPRTVASHLYRIFPKLGVTTRVQLAARLGGGPTPDPCPLPAASTS